MKILKLTTPIVNLKGEQITDSTGEKLTVGKCVANLVLANEKGDVMRSFLLAQELYKEKSIELNASDFELVRLSCEANGLRTYGSILISGQILALLANLKDEVDTKKSKNK